jgi:hypothetical protein
VRVIDLPRLAVAVAAVLAIEHPRSAMKLLRHTSTLIDDPSARFMVGLRMAALAVKRLRDHAGAEVLLKQLTTAAHAAVNNRAVSDADGAAMMALILNLKALVEVQQDRLLDSVATMRLAADTMPEDGFVKLSEDMADRYRGQVRANVVQALWLSGQESSAVAAVNQHATVTRGEHPYSLSEALTLAAYFNELAGRHTLSLSYCHEAERMLGKEGAPSRLAVCRRIAAAALAGSGKVGRAEKLARSLPKDPLGERFLV